MSTPPTRPFIERTNQRDGVRWILEMRDGKPLCPHCNTPMNALQGGTWENSGCRCWWAGQSDGVYPAQVVVAGTPEAEFNFRNTLDKGRTDAAAAHDEELFKARLAYAAGDVEQRVAIIVRLRLLHGKRERKRRIRVRQAVQNGADFDQAYAAPFPPETPSSSLIQSRQT